MTRLDLFFEEVTGQVRVNTFRKRFAVEVDPTMMTAREANNRVDARPVKCVGEFFGVECRANPYKMFAGMKIKKNLTGGYSDHLIFSFCRIIEVQRIGGFPVYMEMVGRSSR